MRRSSRIITVLLVALPAAFAFGQGRDRPTFLRHLDSRADSASVRLERFEARHGQRALRLRGDEKMIGFSRFTDRQPIFREQLDLLSDQSINADSVWPGGSTGFELTGDGVLVGIWDSGYPRVTHVDFSDGMGGSRIDTLGVNRSTRFVYDSSGVTPHAHNMAGIVAAEGVDPGWRGVAYESFVLAYDDTLDLMEMDEASSTFGLRVSNHSYGSASGWGPFIRPDGATWLPSWWGDTTVSQIEDYHRGFYDEESVSWDLFVVTHPEFLPVLAAGNDRDTTQAFPPDSLHWFFSDCTGGENCHFGWSISKEVRLDDDQPDGYDSILGGMQTSKNVLSVGAVYNLDGHCGVYIGPALTMSFYSSWGPTDDGRIKPDLVAPGSRLRVPRYWEDSGGNCIGSGTSHSAPVVVGAIALLLDKLEQRPYLLSTAASMKALLLHTARDLGDVGPDYQFGWGLPDLSTAARLIDEDSLTNNRFHILEDTLQSDAVRSYVVLSDGTRPLRATTAWTDPPGVPVSDASRGVPKTAWLDNDTRMLVNDLDLSVIDRTTVYHPWTLDPYDPSSPAVRDSRNELDNVEQVLIDDPDSSVYVVETSHTGILDGDEQPFSLIVSGQMPTAQLHLKVFLEGPVAGASMLTGPTFDAAVPTETPYGDAFFAGTSVEHAGTEWLYDAPDDLVDWVVVSVRSAPGAVSEVARRSALVRSDGSIVDINGGPLVMPRGGFDSLYVVVDHRNHVAVMSSEKVDVSDGSGEWDFTTSMAQGFTAGGSPMKDLGGGRFGMFACDATVDGYLTVLDFNLWIESTTAGDTGYRPGDCNLDGVVTASDFNLWLANTTAGAASQVPD